MEVLIVLNGFLIFFINSILYCNEINDKDRYI